MATKPNQNQTKTNNMDSLSEVFGILPQSGILLPDVPFAVRANCKMGAFCLDEETILGKELKCFIIGFKRYFGSLGRTRAEHWGLIHFVTAPGNKCDVPSNVVCEMFVKTRSLDRFQQEILRLLSYKTNPAKGLWTMSFVRASGEKIEDGKTKVTEYYWLKCDFQTDLELSGEQQDYLGQIADFMSSQPTLISPKISGMIPTDALTKEQLTLLVYAARENTQGTPEDWMKEVARLEAMADEQSAKLSAAKLSASARRARDSEGIMADIPS